RSGAELIIRNRQRSVGCVNRALAEAGVKAADIARVIVHNLSREEIKAYLGVLGFPLARSTWDFGRGVGHVGASDHVISLDHLLATGQLVPGDRVLLCGFSPGVTYKAAVVEILDLP